MAGKTKKAQGEGKRGRPATPPPPYDREGFGLKSGEVVTHLTIDDLHLDDFTFQYRFSMREDLLVDSVRTHGIQMPVVVRKRPGTEDYQLVCGFRRCHAAKKAGLTSVPAIVRELDDESARILAFAENHDRKTISDLDRANAIEKLRASGKTTKQIGDLYRLKERQVQNLEGLLKYPNDLKEAIASGGVEATHAIKLMQAKRKFGANFRLPEWIQRVARDKPSVIELDRAIKEQVEGKRVRKAVLRERGTALTVNLKYLDGASAEERAKAAARLEEILRTLRG